MSGLRTMPQVKNMNIFARNSKLITKEIPALMMSILIRQGQ